MEEPRTFASLSPRLLARKGGARPAMRTHLQLFQQVVSESLAQSDAAHEQAANELWNDFGETADDPARDDMDCAGGERPRIVPINGQTGMSVATAVPAGTPVKPRNPPEVVRQQDSIGARMAGEGEAADPAQRRSALAEGRRAAFTLRLDVERHLKLRLACAVSNRSAQQIVTEALDRLIADTPEIEALAAKVRRNKVQKGNLS